MFAITGAKGFHITFDNGWTVSVQFGYGNYCDNRYSSEYEGEHKRSDISSTTAEIAAWDEHGRWYEFDTGDTVKGYCSPAEVLTFVNLIAAL